MENQTNPKLILERLCDFARNQMLEKSNQRRWIDFKSSLYLRYSPDFGWGLVVYDVSNNNEMEWLRCSSSGKVLNLGEIFIWKARTEENDMLLQASIGDGSIHLPILGDDKFKLSDDALKIILDCMVSNGAVVSFETLELEQTKKQQNARRRELMSDVSMAEKEFGKTSPQANSARRIALQEMMKMPNELDAKRLKIQIVSKPYSCIEELVMHLDMLEDKKEKEY